MKSLPHNTLFSRYFKKMITSIHVVIEFKNFLFNLVSLRLYFIVTLYLYLCGKIVYIKVIFIQALIPNIKVKQYFTLYLKLTQI